MLKNKYTPKGPIIAGAAKCKKKGHRGKSTDYEFWCTRCNEWVQKGNYN